MLLPEVVTTSVIGQVHFFKALAVKRAALLLLVARPVAPFIITQHQPTGTQAFEVSNAQFLKSNGHRQRHRASVSPRRNQKRTSNLYLQNNKQQLRNDELFSELEKQVRASAQAKVDYNHVVQVLSYDGNQDKGRTAPRMTTSTPKATERQAGDSDWTSENTSLSIYQGSDSQQQQLQPTSSWQIALAAASASSLLTFFVLTTHNLAVSLVCFVAVFWVALPDPVEDDTVLFGAMARLLGRQTLQSYQGTIQPKARAMARAVITGQEELELLQQKVTCLEQENAELRQWKQVRLQAEDKLSQYTLTELKDLNRAKGLPVGGKRTKLQLLVQLLELELKEKEKENNNK
ncbi:hypothetical protein ACA910_016358 [Epithemia clementina (nom. ined.)]